MKHKLILLYLSICYTAVVSAQFGFDNTAVPHLNIASIGGNSSFNQSQTDLLYWRLDNGNSQSLSSNWNMHNYGITNLSQLFVNDGGKIFLGDENSWIRPNLVVNDIKFLTTRNNTELVFQSGMGGAISFITGGCTSSTGTCSGGDNTLQAGNGNGAGEKGGDVNYIAGIGTGGATDGSVYFGSSKEIKFLPSPLRSTTGNLTNIMPITNFYTNMSLQGKLIVNNRSVCLNDSTNCFNYTTTFTQANFTNVAFLNNTQTFTLVNTFNNKTNFANIVNLSEKTIINAQDINFSNSGFLGQITYQPDYFKFTPRTTASADAFLVYKINFYGSANSDMYFQLQSADWGIIDCYTSTGCLIGSQLDIPVVFARGNIERIRLDSNGDLNASFNIKAKGNISTQSYYKHNYLAPTSILNVSGTYVNNSIGNVTTFGDGWFVTVSEVTGAPGYDIRINFTGVGYFNTLETRNYYVGESTHYKWLQIYNYITSSWVTVNAETGTDDDDFEVQSIDIPNPENFISGGVVQTRLYHNGAGVGTHRLYIDYMSLRN